jgi:hypothetical protein
MQNGKGLLIVHGTFIDKNSLFRRSEFLRCAISWSDETTGFKSTSKLQTVIYSASEVIQYVPPDATAN